MKVIYPNSVVSMIASIAHSVNRAYCQSLGDNSQPTWADAPAWQRNSAVAGVRTHLSNDLTPAQAHEVWMKDKESAGWTYGSEKNTDLKTHNCMIPFEQLPVELQIKDALFKSVVDGFKQSKESDNVNK